ncbi:MAG: DnaJ domain-containing protein [Thiotrichales bacterium]|nr:DnaJ domain-containing protein [Thiotrichales bacterium]
MQFRDYYETLGVARGASQDDVKRAYRRLARKYHPDVSKEADAEARFKEVGEAYEVLKDPEKRAAYDRFGKDWKHGQEFRPPPGWERQFDFGGGGFSGASGFSDFFESLFGQGGFAGARGPMRARGGDQSARIEIPLEDAFRGATRNITLRGRTLSVRIPRGVTEGQRIRLSGQGGSGGRGAPDGDLYLTVTHKAHPLFRTEGRDVHLKLPVAPWEAALGATVAVPTLGGKVDLRVPRGSRTGQTLRLKGRGLPGRPDGDQYVALEIVAPPADTPESESLYREMAKSMRFNPRPEFPE